MRSKGKVNVAAIAEQFGGGGHAKASGATIEGTLADIAAKVTTAGITKTAMIVVGQALSSDLPGSKLYHRHFSHGYRVADKNGNGDF